MRGRGGETGASPQRAVTVEPTKASRKRPVARRAPPNFQTGSYTATPDRSPRRADSAPPDPPPGDLYYRLNVFPIQVATLRERTEDIPLLAQHFVRQVAKDLRCPRPRLTRAGVVCLQAYDWPGNVRELRNVIERAVIVARGGPLKFDLPASEEPARRRAGAVNTETATPRTFLTETELRHRERENLLAILESTGWRIKGREGAAELLGIKPTTLLSRMKKMGLRQAG